MNQETIGTCELCGATDHHLVVGVCPGCQPRCKTIMATAQSASDSVDMQLPIAVDEWMRSNPMHSGRYLECNVNHDGPNSAEVNFIDPATVPLILPDEDIEYWGRWFVENNFYARGVRVETFMTNPFEISQALLFGLPMPLPKGEEFYPLLPRQREVALRVHPRVRAISRPARDAELPVFLRMQAD